MEAKDAEDTGTDRTANASLSPAERLPAELLEIVSKATFLAKPRLTLHQIASHVKANDASRLRHANRAWAQAFKDPMFRILNLVKDEKKSIVWRWSNDAEADWYDVETVLFEPQPPPEFANVFRITARPDLARCVRELRLGTKIAVEGDVSFVEGPARKSSQWLLPTGMHSPAIYQSSCHVSGIWLASRWLVGRTV